MTTIDKLDLSVYNLYALRTKMIEQINQQYQLDKASSIPPQTMVMNMYPKMTELDLLLGIVPLHTPWAYFYPPKKYGFVRRSPFAFFRVAPSLGTLDEQEQEERNLESVPCFTPEEEKEKVVIKDCFKQIEEINRWLGYIVGRVGQFLQG
ncbi:MAG: DUF5399 domain-containing protein [Parachlamydiaceae bacterium]|nr:DUF5399 domain-containing protein [Parachlamydiaceae bacterium]